MYAIRRSTRFRKDVRRCKKQNKPLGKFKDIHELLVEGIPLPSQNLDHNLSGNWSGYRECHIEPDWLLIYRIDGEKNVIEYVRMGSHSDLFN
ncbi:MAG: type II toxin-antitoxin system YafQ family toxin [Candidatus Hydrogenedentes bacterium]|nr:type II toxin-antitoxin system YafQ family toxin [Candidatus Hydrogenedentota bacterium]